MRYYIYVSSTKVDMLFAQIPAKLRDKIAGKFTIDLKLLKAEVSQQQIHETLYSKVKIIADYLLQEGLSGSVDEPKGYFRGVLSLRWGPYGPSEKDEAKLVYFGGGTPSTIVGLGGSFCNVIGNIGSSPAHSHSATPKLLSILYKELDLELPSKTGRSRSVFDSDSMGLVAVELASTQMTGTAQRIEFVARKLLWSEDPGVQYDWAPRSGRKVLLGTPIYAALAEV